MVPPLVPQLRHRLVVGGVRTITEILADVARVNAELDAATAAQTTPDQQVRSLTPRGSASRSVSEHNRRSGALSGRCGWTNFIYARTDPSQGRAVWQKCARRICPHCGPRLRQRDLDHDLGKMAGHTMVRKVIAEKAWVSVRAKIKRAGGLRVAYPQPGGMVAVYATAGLVGVVPADLGEAVATDYDRMPEGSRIRRCRPWALNPGRGKADRPGGWGSLGMSSLPPETVPDVLRDQGLYRGEVERARLSPEAWEAHDFMVPELETSAFNRFAYAVGLHQPEPIRRRRKRAA